MCKHETEPEVQCMTCTLAQRRASGVFTNLTLVFIVLQRVVATNGLTLFSVYMILCSILEYKIGWKIQSLLFIQVPAGPLLPILSMSLLHAAYAQPHAATLQRAKMAVPSSTTHMCLQVSDMRAVIIISLLRFQLGLPAWVSASMSSMCASIGAAAASALASSCAANAHPHVMCMLRGVIAAALLRKCFQLLWHSMYQSRATDTHALV